MVSVGIPYSQQGLQLAGRIPVGVAGRPETKSIQIPVQVKWPQWGVSHKLQRKGRCVRKDNVPQECKLRGGIP